jgi:hypothetical protein
VSSANAQNQAQHLNIFRYLDQLMSLNYHGFLAGNTNYPLDGGLFPLSAAKHTARPLPLASTAGGGTLRQRY